MSSRQYLSNIFPLPQPLQSLIQAQAFIISSSNTSSNILSIASNIKDQQSHDKYKYNNKHQSSTRYNNSSNNNNKNRLIRCIQYNTQEQAQQSLINLTTRSNNIFHLQILNLQIKHLSSTNKWCLYIETQSITMSIKSKLTKNKQQLSMNKQKIITDNKQKISMNKNASNKMNNEGISNRFNSQNPSNRLRDQEIIMVLNCINILLKYYINTKDNNDMRVENMNSDIDVDELLDNIFVCRNNKIKYSTPSLIYPSTNKHSNNNNNNNNTINSNKNIKSKSNRNNTINSNKNSNIKRYNRQMIKLSIFIMSLFSSQQQRSLLTDINLLKQQIINIKSQSFPIQQLKYYLLHPSLYYQQHQLNTTNINKQQQHIEDKMKQISVNLNTNNTKRPKLLSHKQQLKQQQQNILYSFPISKFNKSIKNNNIKNHHIKKQINKQSNNITYNQSQHQQQHPYHNNNHNLLTTVNITTLNDLPHDKIVQSFQQDQYSYILQSNKTSPSRISPLKKISLSRGLLPFSNLSEVSQIYKQTQKQQRQKQSQRERERGQYKNSLMSSPMQRRSRYSPSSFSQSHVILQELSNSYQLQQSLKQLHKEQQQSSHQLQYQQSKYQQLQQQTNLIISANSRSRSNSYNSHLQDANSIILQVEQDSNYNDYIQGESSMKSDIIQLSFSRGVDDIDYNLLDNTHQLSKYHNTVSINHDYGQQTLRVIKEIIDEKQNTKYYGQIKHNNIKQGKGKMIYSDGGFYQGQWKNNTITGFGRLFYPSNKLAYAGYWQQGCFHGPGLVLNQHIQHINDQQNLLFDYTDLSNIGKIWISYRGNFNMDVRQGFGVVKLSNGDSISGVWQNNCLNGEAQYLRKDGLKIKGIWRMNKLVKIISQSQSNDME